MKRLFGKLLPVVALLSACGLFAVRQASAAPKADADGTIHVPAFELPESSLLSEQSITSIRRSREQFSIQSFLRPCGSAEERDPKRAPAHRACQKKAFEASNLYRLLKASYPVTLRQETIGGVPTEVFLPADGVSSGNKDRVLINLHGGHFMVGSGLASFMESAPIAATGKFKIVSVDYRMGPEHQFPAASQDVASVYRALLKQYDAKNIGMFGCSAGALLTAQSVAWLQKEGLPRPGAIGMFGGAASYYQDGDSARFASASEGWKLEPADVHPYLKVVGLKDALAYPIYSDVLMRQFPPSLLVSSSRDVALSSVTHTYEKLRELGVDAELRVWEGMGHCFFTHVDGPETRKFNQAVVQFFDNKLGK